MIFTGVELPATSQVSVKIEVNAEVNVSAYVARQKANRFLIMQAGDQLCAGEPELVVGPKLAWRIPVQYAPSRRGPLGIVGHLLVDAESGAVSIDDGQTTEDLMERAEALHARTSL
jgi:hypothetical protein